ncbi:hypothetical protein K438DRAFT_1985778 [Mycena galopus ATCC 62051]|nr:hypothetical protein K438DRAFT_1985778 [Mycena galopus ATCC 62051]
MESGDHIGILPSRAKGQLTTVAQGETILDIAASFIRALDYHPPLFPRNLALREAVVQTLHSWKIGNAVSGFMKCVDVGVAAAELFYPAHEFDLKIVIAICTAGMKWMDNVADDILEALTVFQSRFYARQPQIHPALDCYARFMLRLYDHYEPYVADAMILSSCTFINGSCLEVRALNKRVPTKCDAKLWPYYVRSLSGISGFYSYACFPKKDHPDVVDYVQAIPEMLIFTNFLNDVLRQFLQGGDGRRATQLLSDDVESVRRKPHQDSSSCGDETVIVAKRTSVILKDAPAALKAFKEYEQGYIRFHLDVGHYRLPAAWKAQFSS